jgi:hypothetical protein
VEPVSELGSLELVHRTHDLLAVGEQPVTVQRRVVVLEHRPERIEHRGWVQQLVLDHVHASKKGRDRREQPAARFQLPYLETPTLTGEESRQLVVVEDVVGLIARYVLLQQTEAV